MVHMIETLRGVAHPWLCDGMGHLTTRHYIGFFDDASYHLFAAAGHHQAREKTLGWADVTSKIDYVSETRALELIIIRSAITKIGTKSVTHIHEMRGLDQETIKARMETVTVQFDLTLRRAAPVEPRFRAAAAKVFQLEN